MWLAHQQEETGRKDHIMHQQPYRPKHGDFRISKEPTKEGFRWIWQYQIDNSWLFTASKSELAERDFVATKQRVHADSKYDYWR